MADYATTTDLTNLGILPGALSPLSTTIKEAAITSASRLADSYLAGQFLLPLAAWEEDLTQKVVDIAVWRLLCNRGFNPDNPSDIAIRTVYEDAIKWFEKVAAGTIVPQVTDASSGADVGTSPETPKVYSSEQRGWSTRGTVNDEGPFVGD